MGLDGTNFGDPSFADRALVELTQPNGEPVVFPAGSIPAYVIGNGKGCATLVIVGPNGAQIAVTVKGTPREVFQAFQEGIRRMHRMVVPLGLAAPLQFGPKSTHVPGYETPDDQTIDDRPHLVEADPADARNIHDDTDPSWEDV